MHIGFRHPGKIKKTTFGFGTCEFSGSRSVAVGIRSLALGVFFLVILGSITGCRTLHTSSADSAVTQPVPNDRHGYALLYDLVGGEKDLSKLRFIKQQRPELKALLQEIAQVSREAHSKLEHYGKVVRPVNLKDQGLPAVEMETRNAIAKFKEKAILSGKDKDLEIELLLSQNEALTYGTHLAATIARSTFTATSSASSPSASTTISS